MATWGPIQVIASDDDACERGDGGYFGDTFENTYVFAHADPGSSSYFCGGLRWQNVTVPKNAVITSATLSIYLSNVSYDNPNCVIYGNKVADALDFADIAHIISEGDRPRTTESKSWVDTTIGTGWKNAPDLKDVIQEIVDQATWASGNALVLLLIANTNNSNQLIAYSYDEDSIYGAKLTIVYEANTPPTAPTSLEVDGQSTPTGANCVTTIPLFTAIFNDPDAGDQSNAIEIQVGSASGLSDMWDSGWLADSTIDGNRCSAKTYAGAALSEGTSYWWRCRFRDDDDAEGTPSDWQQFDVCAVEPEPEAGLLECAPGGPLPKRCPFRCAVALSRKVPSWAY